MLHQMKKTTLTIAILLTGMAAATAQAGDIKPLHHVCTANSAANYSGSLAAGNTADIRRFTCPVGTSGSFEYRVRDINSPDVATDARSKSGAAGTTVIDSVSGNVTFSAAGLDNANGPYDVRIDKAVSTAAQVNYELCVRCYQSDNEGGADAAPASVTYIQNQ
jgi:hypothetical protein